MRGRKDYIIYTWFAYLILVHSKYQIQLKKDNFLQIPFQFLFLISQCTPSLFLDLILRVQDLHKLLVLSA